APGRARGLAAGRQAVRQSMKKWYVYFLESQKDKNLYVGMSEHPLERLKEHNAGKTFSTRSRRPFLLIYEEGHPTREAARKREMFLKSYAGVKEKRKIRDNIKNIGE
ncbi:MAG: GIY-YIG nuclease family protein, partial [bacterium]|nr:GIY-YIG nuclease family protein [bacterium]